MYYYLQYKDVPVYVVTFFNTYSKISLYHVPSYIKIFIFLLINLKCSELQNAKVGNNVYPTPNRVQLYDNY